MSEDEFTMLPPSQTAMPVKIAIRLGLTLVPFDGKEWIGTNGEGYFANVTKLYWLHGSQFHSGPFHTVERALDFLYNYYIEEQKNLAEKQHAQMHQM